MNQPLSAFEIRRSLLARNILLNFISQGLLLVVAVVSMPLLIWKLGMARFGILALGGVTLGYFNAFDLGLRGATTKFVAEALGRGNQERVPVVIWTAVTIQAVFGVLGGLILAAAAPVLVVHMLRVPYDLLEETRSSLYLLAASLPIVFVSGSFRGVLEAAQRFDLVNSVNLTFGAANFLLPLFGALIGWDISGIVALLVVSQSFALAVQYWLSIRVFPSLKGGHRFLLAELRTLMSFGGWLTVSNIIAPALLYLDRFLVGVFLTLPAVTYYAVPFGVINRLSVIPTSLVITLFPAFSTLGVTRQVELQRLCVRSMKYLLLIAGPPLLLFTFFADLILQCWLGTSFVQQSTLPFRILLLGALFAILAPLPGNLLLGLGRPDIIAKLYAMYLLPNAVLAWLLIKYMGISGAALSYFIRALVNSALLVIIASKKIDLHFKVVQENGFWRVVILLTGFGMFLCLASLIGVGFIQVGIVGIAIFLFVMLTWHYVLDNTDREVIISAMGIFDFVLVLKHKAKHLLIKLFAQNKPFRTKVHGMPMYIYPNTAETCAYFCRPFEPYTTELLERVVKQGAKVLDIGAQFGYFSLIAARQVGQGGTVYAFEPVPPNFELLKRNITLNRCDSIVRAVPKAVGDRHKMVTLFLYEGSDSHSMYRCPTAFVKGAISVECVTIDEFLGGQPVNVIKMDIDGNEPYALEGMKQTIAKSRNLVMFCEFAPAYIRRGGVEPQAYLAQLFELSFEVKLIDERSRCLRPVTKDIFNQQDPAWYANFYCMRTK